MAGPGSKLFDLDLAMYSNGPRARIIPGPGVRVKKSHMFAAVLQKDGSHKLGGRWPSNGPPPRAPRHSRGPGQRLGRGHVAKKKTVEKKKAAPPPRVPKAEVPVFMWQCTTCTCHNVDKHLACSACGTARAKNASLVIPEE